jgi:hypothetical protein
MFKNQKHFKIKSRKLIKHQLQIFRLHDYIRVRKIKNTRESKEN